jgi:hypothetical protein
MNNFQRRGYALSEVSAILVTSSHYSAYEELTVLFNKIGKAASRGKLERKVEVYLERRVHERFPGVHGRTVPGIMGPLVLAPDNTTPICDGGIVVTTIDPCTGCKHASAFAQRGAYESPSLLALLDFVGGPAKRAKVAFVNDLCPSSPNLDQLKNANLLVLSVGTLDPNDLFRGYLPDSLRSDFMNLFKDDALYMGAFGIEKVGDLETEANKPDGAAPGCNVRLEPSIGIEGVLSISESLRGRSDLLILGDLPTYTTDKRHTLAAVLNREYGGTPRFLTEDIGLVVDLETLEVLCEYEHRRVPAAIIEEQCLEGDPTGPVKHFCGAHRGKLAFDEMLKREF